MKSSVHFQGKQNRSLCISFIIFFIFSFLQLHGQLNGTYTIGGVSPDYADFTSAVTDLVSQGVDGDVTFEVANGTYDEQLVIPTYTGNTQYMVTFRSATGDSTAVTLRYNANSSDNYTVKLDTAQNVAFKKMTLKAQNSSYSRVIDITKKSSGIQLMNNRIIGMETTESSDELATIYNNGKADTINISHNNIQNGSYAIYIRGSSGNENDDIYIEGNTITGQGNIALFFMYLDAPYVGDNTISADANAINLYYNTGTAEIEKNKVITGATKDAISLYGVTCNIHNNMVIAEGNGMIMWDCIDVNAYYNSIKSTKNYSAILIGAGQTIDVQNNILYNSGSGKALQIDDMVPNTYTSDYNCLYSSGSILVNNLFDNYESLSDYRAASSHESNSISTEPKFYSDTDLHTNDPSLNGQGTTVFITTDIDGEERDGSSPDIGVDEFTPATYDVGVYEIATNISTSCSNVKVSVTNYGGSSMSNIPVKAIVTTPSQTTETLTTTIAGPIWQGASTTITVGSISSTQAGTYTIKAFTGHNDDEVNDNDTLKVTIDKQSDFTIPHTEPFETASDKENWELGSGYHINPPGSVTYLKYIDGQTTGDMSIMKNSIGPVVDESYLIFDFYTETTANANINLYILAYECDQRVDTLYSINGSTFPVNPIQTYKTPIGDNAGKYIRLAVNIEKGSSDILECRFDNITIANAPVVDLGEDLEACAGTTVTLDAGAGTGYTYEWTKLPSNSQGSGQTLDVTTDGEYMVVVTEPDHGLTSSDTVNVTFGSTITANDQAPDVCEDTQGGGSASGIDLTGHDEDINGGTGNTVNWLDDAYDPVSTPGNASVTNGQVFYAEVVSGTCVDTATVTYTVNTLPIVTFSAIADVEDTDPAFDLTQGSPDGGVYSGTGITTSPGFDPSVAGIGTHTITYTYTDANECTNTETQTITVVDGPVQIVQENSISKGFTMYPNPVSDVVNILVNETSDVTIYNQSGEKKVNIQIEEQIIINCSGMAPGIYIVVVNNNTGSFIKKLVIQ